MGWAGRTDDGWTPMGDVDMTFSPPKDFSILWALADQGVPARPVIARYHVEGLLPVTPLRPFGWWCRECGTYTAVDDEDICEGCAPDAGAIAVQLLVACECPCGRRIQATQPVLEEAPITCGTCEGNFVVKDAAEGMAGRGDDVPGAPAVRPGQSREVSAPGPCPWTSGCGVDDQGLHRCSCGCSVCGEPGDWGPCHCGCPLCADGEGPCVREYRRISETHQRYGSAWRGRS
jgi:hypothetical protein